MLKVLSPNCLSTPSRVARVWAEVIVRWYNTEYRHSALHHVTPSLCHLKDIAALLRGRRGVRETARKKNPWCWIRARATRDHDAPGRAANARPLRGRAMSRARPGGTRGPAVPIGNGSVGRRRHPVWSGVGWSVMRSPSVAVAAVPRPGGACTPVGVAPSPAGVGERAVEHVVRELGVGTGGERSLGRLDGTSQPPLRGRASGRVGRARSADAGRGHQPVTVLGAGRVPPVDRPGVLARGSRHAVDALPTGVSLRDSVPRVGGSAHARLGARARRRWGSAT